MIYTYKINFNKNTRVKECSSFKVGYNRFHFVEFDKLLNHHVEDNTYIGKFCGMQFLFPIYIRSSLLVLFYQTYFLLYVDLIGELSGCYDIEDTEINGHPMMKLDCNIMDLKYVVHIQTIVFTHI